MTADAEWDRLTAWWRSWTPPAEPYTLRPGVRVPYPLRAYGYYLRRIDEGCAGQVRIAVLDWLRRHAEMFGASNPSLQKGEQLCEITSTARS